MNKFFTKLLFACALLFYTASNALYAQCTTAIYITHDTIACGESILLQQTGVGGTSSDDFSAGTLSGLWQGITSGWSLTSPCGTNPLGGQHMFFAQGSSTPREATTVAVDASCGGNICFDFKMETQSPPPCDGPDLPGEGVYLQYSLNGATWVTIYYFNPQTYNFAGWNNYCYPIPAAAQTSATHFRWSQTSTSGASWDLWGIDNVNIATCTGYSSLWFNTAISTSPFPNPLPPAISANDTITVFPQVSTTYTIIYSDWATDTCTANVTINVEMPTIVASQTPSNCTGSTQLDALASIPANCNYTIELWDGVGDGWNAGGSPANYHNMDVHVNNSLYRNFTMITGSGPQVHQVAVTDGDVLETFLQNWGTNYSDCGYVIKDSQGVIVRLDGLPPVLGNPMLGCNTNLNSHPEVNVTCPTTLFYSYSWQTTAGTVTGLSNPNIYNPSVTVSTSTDYVVTGYDPAHPWCTATDTVTVLPNSSNITATLSGPTSICTGDPVTLSFLPMVGLANWYLTLNINGTTQPVYTLDGSGNDTATGQPLTFYPTTTTTYDVVTLLDGTGCPAAVTNPSLTVTVNSIPNAGGSASITVCETNPFFDLYSILTGSPNLGGTWTNSAGTILTSSFYDPSVTGSDNFTYTVYGIAPCSNDFSIVSVTNNTLPDAGQNAAHTVCENGPAFNMYNFLGGAPFSGGSWSDASGSSVSNMFDPSTMSSGVFTYTVPAAFPCPSNSADLTVIINQIPSAGANGIHTVCEDDGLFNLFNYLTGSPDVGGIWTDVNNIPVPNMFNPSTSGSGTFIFTYTVLGAIPCPNATATVTITVNPGPVVTISGTISVTQGMSTTIDFTLTTGTAPFTVVYDDGTGPITSPLFNSNTGTITVTPNNTTNYNLVSVTDANGCTASVSGSVTITVNQLPTATISGNATICEGQNSDLDFNLGGTPNFTVEYTINGVPNSYMFNSTGSNLLNVSPVITTTYTLVSITDGNGVVENNVSGSVTITVNPLPTVTANSSPVSPLCDGDALTLTGGGAGITGTYTWDQMVVDNIPFTPSIGTVIYTVTGTDVNSCSDIATISVTVNPLPIITAISSPVSPLCDGDILTLTGGGATSYIWDNSVVDNTPFTPLVGIVTYTVTGTDVNSCINTDMITVTVNPLPTVTMSGSASICDGQSTPLDLNFTGTGPYNINYDINSTNTSAVLNNNIDSIIVSPSTTTTYNLTDVTDSYCSNTANGTVIVMVNSLPSATISGGATLCADGSTAQIDINANGMPPYNVIYSDGFNNIALNGISSPYNFQTNTPGTYTLSSITDVNGCAGSVTGVATIVVNPLPVASFSFMPQPIDINNPTVYFTDLSSGHVAGVYDFGDGITEPTVLLGQLQHTYLDTGSYQVLYSVTSIDGCVASVSHTIIIDPAFLIYIPTAFTPNRDGRNDVFIPILMGVDEYNFYIYNRFGELVFETAEQLEGWDGKVNGGEFAISGHYAYAVQIIDLLGKKLSFTGSITLIR